MPWVLHQSEKAPGKLINFQGSGRLLEDTRWQHAPITWLHLNALTAQAKLRPLRPWSKCHKQLNRSECHVKILSCNSQQILLSMWFSCSTHVTIVIVSESYRRRICHGLNLKKVKWSYSLSVQLHEASSTVIKLIAPYCILISKT